jgi:hypothetical protein
MSAVSAGGHHFIGLDLSAIQLEAARVGIPCGN